ncbi:MAG TPA: hypothetical protein VFJ85_13410 [Acidimicrobiales bacterium]|nr:hypothetical protein [Acidimicrobiales bacterium]
MTTVASEREVAAGGPVRPLLPGAAGAGGPAEIGTHDVDGLLYPPGDERRLAADPISAAGSAPRARAQAFAPAAVAAQVEAFYRRVLEVT